MAPPSNTLEHVMYQTFTEERIANLKDFCVAMTKDDVNTLCEDVAYLIRYRCGPDSWQRAVRLIEDGSEEWPIDVNKGHLESINGVPKLQVSISFSPRIGSLSEKPILIVRADIRSDGGEDLAQALAKKAAGKRKFVEVNRMVTKKCGAEMATWYN